jgi:hypothetical protein
VRAYRLTQLSDAILLADLAEIAGRDRATTAELLAYLSEVDARRLFRPAGYSSMYDYCIDALHMSEDAAYKRIQAARVCRRFPQVFVALAEGRLHLAAVCLLAPHLTPGNADQLFALASGQRKWEIEKRLAAHFPRTERMTLVEVYAAPAAVTRASPEEAGCNSLLAPGQVRSCNEGEGDSMAVGEPSVPGESSVPDESSVHGKLSAPGESWVPAVDQIATEFVSVVAGPERARHLPAGSSAEPRTSLVPLATQRFALQVTLAQSTYDKLRHALALLSHVVPEHDVAQVLDRALELLIRHLERQKLGAPQPRASRRPVTDRRHVPASVRRAVWERDGGRCTFVGDTGHRCEERRFLEFDHMDPVALGGSASVERIRLRCRAHNQYEAEQVFGARFMTEKREGQAPPHESLAATRHQPSAASGVQSTERRNAPHATTRDRDRQVEAGRGVGSPLDP